MLCLKLIFSLQPSQSQGERDRDDLCPGDDLGHDCRSYFIMSHQNPY